MNQHIVERSGRVSVEARFGSVFEGRGGSSLLLNRKIREYYNQEVPHSVAGDWLAMPEVPAADEFLSPLDRSEEVKVNPHVKPNRLKGAWESKEIYLEAMYRLLREDSIYGLRRAMNEVRLHPAASEGSHSDVAIYDKVYMCGITISTRGLAIRAVFSLTRVGKKIPWEQTKRLTPGSLVLLSPVKDNFGSKVLVAEVAARPLQLLQETPPKVDLFIEVKEDLLIDPAEEYIMVGEKSGLYEAYRHTLTALQRHAGEISNFDEQFVYTNGQIEPPQYVLQHPSADTSTIFEGTSSCDNSIEKADVLRSWPKTGPDSLDTSQYAALERMITKKLAIIQGPPGTGKTHISVQAIRYFLGNKNLYDSPIIIASQTNHASDQLLGHVAAFEENFARLGGRTQDKDVIKSRTLYELRDSVGATRPRGSLFGQAMRKMRALEKDIVAILQPLAHSEKPLDPHLLQRAGLLTENQVSSLISGAAQWVKGGDGLTDGIENAFGVWLDDQLIPVPFERKHEEYAFDFDQADMEEELIDDPEKETPKNDEDAFDSLLGTFVAIADNFTCRRSMKPANAKKSLKQQDMWQIPERERAAVYLFLQSEMKCHVSKAFFAKSREYRKAVSDRQIGNWERDELILRQQNVIGMTTTGLSKYRALIAALEPKIVIIEEAAETLEPQIIAACLPSVEHLILVGDHEQLRPNCQAKPLQDSPYWFNISLFERMIKNQIGHSTLVRQRRMIPQIRKLLTPIYGNIISDHPCVLDSHQRPSVPGMGGVNTLFVTHEWQEERDSTMSVLNTKEADMVAGMYCYLVHNGMDTNDITVLAFYNGQRKRILHCLRSASSPNLKGRTLKVVTVDSYQGEENKVILLSLARSNRNGQLGFLNIRNRICVALSRAQCGLYIFGNGRMMFKDKTWGQVLRILGTQGLSTKVPLYCAKHQRWTEIKDPDDWSDNFGGCQMMCDERLACGHPCPIRCHPFSHQDVTCVQICGNRLPCCKRACQERCGEECVCKKCGSPRGMPKNVKKSKVVDLDQIFNTILQVETRREPGEDLLAGSGGVSYDGTHVSGGLEFKRGSNGLLVDLGDGDDGGCKSASHIPQVCLLD